MSRLRRSSMFVPLLAMSLGACGDPTRPIRTTPEPVPVPDIVRQEARPITGAADYDALIDAAGGSEVVLIGEASHGTHEFYRERAVISRRLIEEAGFAAVVVEGAWPSAEPVNIYVRGEGGTTPDAALAGFSEFPEWMWRNTVVRDFVQELRELNAGRTAERQVGFYGMDVYSVYESMAAVEAYLAGMDAAAAARARTRYACFDDYDDVEEYAASVRSSASLGCTAPAAEQLEELEARLADAPADPALFSAVQNARVVANGEAYYRVAYAGTGSSWNVRDRHMAETLDALAAHLRARGQEGRIIVWAHNSHVGDARATDMGGWGELNVGQLMRERHGTGAFLIGFTTYTGTVRAAHEWGGRGVEMNVLPSLAGSHGAMFNQLEARAVLLILRGSLAADELSTPMLQRAIGVIYRPQTERTSHYLHARLAGQFDAVIHVDVTTALAPSG